MITGVHHITAMVSDPLRTLKTYTQDLGLRLVKRTVNFDAPDIHHLYLGNGSGEPGTILTFFPFMNMKKGTLGQGQLTYTGFSVPSASLPWWENRLIQARYLTEPVFIRNNQAVLRFYDQDGMGLELIGNDADTRTPWITPEIDLHHAIRGFQSVVLDSYQPELTIRTLTALLNYDIAEEGQGWTRLSSTTKVDAAYIEVVQSHQRGHPGAGTVHHVAFSTPNDRTQSEFLEKLKGMSGSRTPIHDRIYFKSIYFREPGGILFEVATNTPGFQVDEALESLGNALMLPPWLEPDRQKIEKHLSTLTVI